MGVAMVVLWILVGRPRHVHVIGHVGGKRAQKGRGRRAKEGHASSPCRVIGHASKAWGSIQGRSRRFVVDEGEKGDLHFCVVELLLPVEILVCIYASFPENIQEEGVSDEQGHAYLLNIGLT